MFCNDFIYYFIAIKTVMVASGETDWEGAWGNFQGGRNVLYLERDCELHGYIYLLKISRLCTSDLCVALYVNYASTIFKNVK